MFRAISSFDIASIPSPLYVLNMEYLFKLCFGNKNRHLAVFSEPGFNLYVHNLETRVRTNGVFLVEKRVIQN